MQQCAEIDDTTFGRVTPLCFNAISLYECVPIKTESDPPDESIPHVFSSPLYKSKTILTTSASH